MTAFNFTINIDKIKDGTKLSTIRKTKRCNVGDTMQLYTGLRTKNCRKLRDAVCIGTAKIKICLDVVWQTTGIEGNIHPKKQPLHEQEGFANAFDMLKFFYEKYGLPFEGWLHVWEIKND